jgi:RNase P protein component
MKASTVMPAVAYPVQSLVPFPLVQPSTMLAAQQNVLPAVVPRAVVAAVRRNRVKHPRAAALRQIAPVLQPLN